MKYNNNAVVVFSHKICAISVKFSAGVLSYPRGLAFDDITGLLYIAENGAHRIAVMDLSTGQVVRTFGRGKGTALDQFNYPNGVALDGHGNLLVADTGDNRVVVWNTSNNTPVTSFPTQSYPGSLCVDSKGNVIVGGYQFVTRW